MTDLDPVALEAAAYALIAVRGGKMYALPKETIWLAYNKEQTLEEAKATIRAYLKAAGVVEVEVVKDV